MTRDFITVRPVIFPGLHIVHDPMNERYLYTDSQPKQVRSLGAPRAEDETKSKAHHQYARFDQALTPKCTGFSGVTYCAAAHEYNRPPVSGDEWYARNQENDRKDGNVFDEGATVTASMKTGQQLGLWSVYRWIYDVPNMERAIQDRPLLGGTVWYPEMFERDKEGIVRMPSKTSTPVGGHMFHIGAWNKKRGLWRIDNTWKPEGAELSLPYKGWCYFIPAELMYRLVREEGEIAVPDEVKLAA